MNGAGYNAAARSAEDEAPRDAESGKLEACGAPNFCHLRCTVGAAVRPAPRRGPSRCGHAMPRRSSLRWRALQSAEDAAMTTEMFTGLATAVLAPLVGRLSDAHGR